MTPKQLSKKITELCLHRETLEDEKRDLLNQGQEAKQLPSVTESVKQSAKIRSQINAIDAELVIIQDLIDDESSGLDTAIESLRQTVTDNEREHTQAVRQALKEFLQGDDVKQAKRVIAALEEFAKQINPMIDFSNTEAFTHLMRNSRQDQVTAFAELVTLPEEKPEPPELEILVDAQRRMLDSTPMQIVTAGSEPRPMTRTSAQSTAADMAAARAKREQQSNVA